MNRSPHGLRIANVGNRQGRDSEASRRATLACCFGLLYWLAAPVRWMRTLNVGDWFALVILANVVCAMVWGK